MITPASQIAIHSQPTKKITSPSPINDYVIQQREFTYHSPWNLNLIFRGSNTDQDIIHLVAYLRANLVFLKDGKIQLPKEASIGFFGVSTRNSH